MTEPKPERGGAPLLQKGIVTGCDKYQEWLLAWWWEHYSAHNAYPVAFADFGMSKTARDWCQERGVCFEAPQIDFPKRKGMDPERKQLWESYFGPGMWRSREVCLRKPFAFSSSPFPYSCWIDLDCKIRGSVEPLFLFLESGREIGARKEDEQVHKLHREKGFLAPEETEYNTGVIPYRRDSKILQEWTEEIRRSSEEFIHDQRALSRALLRHREAFAEISPLFNWSPGDGPNPEALIYHFHGSTFKDPAFLMFFP